MKAINYFFVLFALFAICSCSSIPQKMLKLVNEAEQNYKSYTEDDWNEFTLKFEKLSEKFEYSDKDYSEKEYEMKNRAIGKYHALIVSKGVNSSVDKIKEMAKGVSSYIEGITQGISESTSSTDDTTSLKDDIVNKIDGVMSSLGKEISKLVDVEE